MVNENKKIMEDSAIQVAVTCGSEPQSLAGHSGNLFIISEHKQPAGIDCQSKSGSKQIPGAVLQDDQVSRFYPQALTSVGKTEEPSSVRDSKRFRFSLMVCIFGC